MRSGALARAHLAPPVVPIQMLHLGLVQLRDGVQNELLQHSTHSTEQPLLPVRGRLFFGTSLGARRAADCADFASKGSRSCSALAIYLRVPVLLLLAAPRQTGRTQLRTSAGPHCAAMAAARRWATALNRFS